MKLSELHRTHLKSLPKGAKPPVGEPDPRTNLPVLQRSERPACPRWVRPAGVKIWRELVMHLERVGTLDGADRQSLANYCDDQAMRVEMVEALREKGYTVTFESGARQLSPEFIAISQLDSRIRMREKEFGLTPKARAQILYSSYGGRPLATPGPNRPNRRGAYRKKAGAP